MSNKYLDYKVTTWVRVYFPDDTNLEEIIQELETTTPDCLSIYDDNVCVVEELLEAQEYISVNDNDGFSTIVIYEDNDLIWDNSYDSEITRNLNNKDAREK
jgi:hypothetical protein